jgi:hypothetical protein
VAVVGLEQVRLRPAAHLSDIAAGIDGHGKCCNLELYHNPEENQQHARRNSGTRCTANATITH